MSFASAAFVRQKLCVDYATLKHACPKGAYVAPVPDHPLLWTGVLFVRQGKQRNALRRNTARRAIFARAYSSSAQART